MVFAPAFWIQSNRSPFEVVATDDRSLESFSSKATAAESKMPPEAKAQARVSAWVLRTRGRSNGVWWSLGISTTSSSGARAEKSSVPLIPSYRTTGLKGEVRLVGTVILIHSVG